MPILNIVTEQIGGEGTKPRIIHIQTNDTVAEVTATGYLNNSVYKNKIQFLESDMVLVITKTSEGALTEQVGWFEISHINNNWSLVQPAAPGTVILPTTIGHVATYNDMLGTLTEDPDTAIIENDLWVQDDIIVGDPTQGKAGSVIINTPTASKGSLQLYANDNTGNYSIAISNYIHGQITSYILMDVGSSDGTILTSAINYADISPNLLTFNITVTAAALASAQSVILKTSGTIEAISKQYRILNLSINAGGTNFSGGGGDRALSITDGTSTYSAIPAATLQSLVNADWGNSNIPYPAFAKNTLTVATANLVAKYSGGTTDYAAGSVVIGGLLQRVV